MVAYSVWLMVTGFVMCCMCVVVVGGNSNEIKGVIQVKFFFRIFFYAP